MISQRQYQIIQFLKEMQQPVTSQTIAQKIGVSARTIKNEINQFKDEYLENGFSIKAKKGSGYVLDVFDYDTFSEFIREYATNQNHNTLDERNCLLLCILLMRTDTIHLNELEELMYCNRNSILQSISRITPLLKEHDLNLKSSNKGYLINGKEFNKRVCIHNLLKRKYAFIKEELKNYICDIQIKKNITAIVITCLHEEDEQTISKVSIDEIVDYLYLSYMRNSEDNTIILSKQDWELKDEFPITYQTSLKITSHLHEKYGFQYTKEDVIFLLILLMSYRISNINFAKDSLKQELNQIAQRCVLYVQQKMGILPNAQEDDLYMNIVRYLRSFQLRNKYKIIIRIDYISYVKIRRSFLSALDMSYYCLEYLYNKYGYIINEDEILYLTPCFVGYQNLLHEKNKYNALVIASSGIMFGGLVAERLQRDFKDYLKTIDVKEYYLINDRDLEGIDIILSDLTAQELDINDIPVCQFNSLLEDPNDQINILHFLSGLGKLKINDIFTQDQLLINWDVDNKNEVFYNLINTLGRFYTIDDKTLLLREMVRKESVFSHECGNNAAICFLYNEVYEKERIFIIILKRPIIWEKEIVQIIFVLCINKRNYGQYLYLIGEISQLIQNYSSLLLLINTKDYETVSRLIGNSLLPF